MADQLAVEDPIRHHPLRFTTADRDALEVITHQRKPRPAHLKALAASMERLGVLTPLVTVERDGRFVIIDGQHRFLAATELGVDRFPIVVVPAEVARRMMSLNVEQTLNIRERASIALSIYEELKEEAPDRPESDGEVVDTIETAYLVTLGLAYQRSGRLAGSAFEPILKNCDGFVDATLAEAFGLRQERAGRVIEAADLVKEVEGALKERGSWHSMARYQIISSANPTKRARKAAAFDSTFDKFITALERLREAPEKVLAVKVAE